MTSVTIPEKIRKRLKKLAAEYDTTQGKIIEMALDVMENKSNVIREKPNKDNEIEQILREVSEKVRERDPKLKKRREILEKEGISINEVIAYSWGFNFEDINR
jgi:predicted transcriptional regulator